MNERGYYILDGKVPKRVSQDEYYSWRGGADRVVKKDDINGVQVSTIFLGLDHSLYRDGTELFETMIFGGDEDGYQTRCGTWREAENQHQKAINIVKGGDLLKQLP